jgi:protein arginine kinase activator
VSTLLCQNCNMRTATVHFTQITNNKKTEMYLCEVCAKEKNKFGMNIPMDISNFFAGFTGIPSELKYARDGRQQAAVCDGCGMSYEEFRKTGKMGCSRCYDLYGERIKPLLKRIHGSVSHTGKAPEKIAQTLKMDNQLSKMKAELEAAVQREDYERAAELRDKIRELERSTKKQDLRG